MKIFFEEGDIVDDLLLSKKGGVKRLALLSR